MTSIATLQMLNQIHNKMQWDLGSYLLMPHNGIFSMEVLNVAISMEQH
jgi:hypothetical protein